MKRDRLTRLVAAISACLLTLIVAPTPAHARASGSLGTVDDVLISPLTAMPALVFQWITLATRADNIKVTITGSAAGHVHEISMFGSPCVPAGSSGPWTCIGGSANDKIKIVYILVTPTPPPAESVSTVSATGGFNGVTYSASGTLIVRPVADLGISASYQTGSSVTRAKLSVPVPNYGPDLSHSAIVTITILGDASGVSSFPGCSQSGSTITCTVGQLSSTEIQPYTFTFPDTVPPTARRFTATVKGLYVDANKANNTATAGYGSPSSSGSGSSGGTGPGGGSSSGGATSAATSPSAIVAGSPTPPADTTASPQTDAMTPEPPNAAGAPSGVPVWVWPALVVVLLGLTGGGFAVLRQRRGR